MGILGDVVGSVVGGLFGNKTANDAADKANEANKEINERNLQFAQNATKIRVDDMRNAGINPLLATNPGAAASAPQQIGAQKADVGGVVSAASGVGRLFQERDQKEIAKAQLSVNMANSAADVAKKSAEVDNLHAQNANLQSQNKLLNEQATTQAAQRALMASQGGMYSASQAGTLLKNREQQMILDHWGTPTGRQAFESGLNTKAGGVVGQGVGLGGIIQNALDKLIAPSQPSAKRQQIDKDLESGKRKSVFSMPGLRVTKEK